MQNRYEDLRNEERGRMAEANHEQNMLQISARLVVSAFQPLEPPVCRQRRHPRKRPALTSTTALSRAFFVAARRRASRDSSGSFDRPDVPDFDCIRRNSGGGGGGNGLERHALQCHGASHQSVDRAATARSLPGGSCTQVLDP
jgi:hypothetical protein